MEIKKYLDDYYNSELTAGKVLVGIGLSVIGLAYLISVSLKGGLAYGILFCLLPFGVFQALSGVVICIRKTFRKNKLEKELQQSGKIDLLTESLQIADLVKRYRVIRMIQEAILLMSFITIFLGMADFVNVPIMGFAMAGLFMAGIMIAYDLFALRRAEEYLRRLQRINKN